MEKRKLKTIMLTCFIMISTCVLVSVLIKPGTADVSGTFVEKPGLENETTQPHGEITVIGIAQQECKPDLLCIYLKIITLDQTSAIKARDDAALIIASVLDSLKNLGITEQDIETVSYNIVPKYEWENDNHVFKGYEVTVTMKVTLKIFDKAGQVIDASVNAGALIDKISFELSKDKQNEIKTQVMADAAKDAKVKAQAVASALDEELGRVKSVSIDNYGYSPYDFWNSVSYAEAYKTTMVPPTSILPSDLTVSATVNVVFEML